MLSDLPKVTEFLEMAELAYGVFGNGRAGVQAALKEQISGAANWVCQNLHVKTSRKAITFYFRACRSTKKTKQREIKTKHIVSVKSIESLL